MIISLTPAQANILQIKENKIVQAKTEMNEILAAIIAGTIDPKELLGQEVCFTGKEIHITQPDLEE